MYFAAAAAVDCGLPLGPGLKKHGMQTLQWVAVLGEGRERALGVREQEEEVRARSLAAAGRAWRRGVVIRP